MKSSELRYFFSCVNSSIRNGDDICIFLESYIALAPSSHRLIFEDIYERVLAGGDLSSAICANSEGFPQEIIYRLSHNVVNVGDLYKALNDIDLYFSRKISCHRLIDKSVSSIMMPLLIALSASLIVAISLLAFSAFIFTSMPYLQPVLEKSPILYAVLTMLASMPAVSLTALLTITTMALISFASIIYGTVHALAHRGCVFVNSVYNPLIYVKAMGEVVVPAMNHDEELSLTGRKGNIAERMVLKYQDTRSTDMETLFTVLKGKCEHRVVNVGRYMRPIAFSLFAFVSLLMASQFFTSLS